MINDSNKGNDFFNPAAVFFAMVLLAFLIWLASCSSHHYFSINAEEMSNPVIEYSDSTHLTNPF